MAEPITKYRSNDGKEYDTMEEAEARDIELKLGEQAEAYVATLGLSKGGKILKERILGWERFKTTSSDNVVDIEDAREA